MKQYLHFFRSCALVILLSAISVVAFSATILSNGTGGGLWSSTAWANTARTGTITTSTASATVTGSGTSFLTQINVGSIIKNTAGTVIGTVASVTSNTSLTLTANAASTNAGIAFQFQGIGSGDAAAIRGGDIVTINVANATCIGLAGDNTGAAGAWGLVFNAGTKLTSTGAVTIGDAGHAGTVDMTNGGTLKATTLSTGNAGSTLTPGSGTIELTTTSNFPALFATVNNLTISGGIITTTGGLTINGNLLINNGTGNFTVGPFPLTVAGTTTVGGGASGKLTLGSATGAKVFNGRVAIATGASWLNTGNAAAEFHGGISNGGGIFTAGTGVQTFNTADQDLAGVFSIPNLTVNDIVLTNGGVLTVTNSLNGTGTLTQAEFATLNIQFTAVPAIAAIDATASENNVYYNLGGAQTVYGAHYYNLFLSTSGLKTLPIALTNIDGDFTLEGTASTAGVADLTIGRNVVTGTGTVMNAGDFTYSIAGDITNNGAFNAGTLGGPGTILFDGSGLQTITNGPTGTGHIENITVNNSGPGIILGSDITSFTSLNMTQGNIDLGGHQLALGSYYDKTGTLTHTSGTIIGAGSFLRWFPAAAIPDGSDAGLYPVGTATDYRPIYISGGGGGGTLAVTYADDQGNSTVSVADGAENIAVRKNFSWTFFTPGTVPLPAMANGNYNVRAVASNFGSVGDVNDLRLMLASSVVGTAGANGGTTTAPEINRTGVTIPDLYSTFYIGTVDPVSTPLPITLLSFTASAVNGSVKLDWVTTSEINNDHFTIQRSRNSADWENVKVVPGAVNSSVNVKYSEYDETPYQGVSYYRLQQTDIDGKTSFSPIVSVKIGQSTSINVYPNPTSDHLWVTTIGSGKLSVVLYNNNGRRINVPVTVNGNNARLDVGALSAGTYFVHILQGGQSESRVVLIAK